MLSAFRAFEGCLVTTKINDPEYDITIHRLIHAVRFKYGQRTNYGDPAYIVIVSALVRLSNGAV